MKKLLLGLSLLYSPFSFADMIYDPSADIFYTSPEGREINQLEYIMLLLYCFQIKDNMKSVNYRRYLSDKEVMNQLAYYLRKIGSPTALRLIADLGKAKIFYPNGSVAQSGIY